MDQKFSEFSELGESDKSLKQFKDPTSYMCLVCSEIISWSLTHETAGSNPFTVIRNIFATEFSQFRENFEGGLKWFPSSRDIATFSFINILQFNPEIGNLPNWHESDPDSSGHQQNILQFVAENESSWKWTALVQWLQIHILYYNIAS